MKWQKKEAKSKNIFIKDLHNSFDKSIFWVDYEEIDDDSDFLNPDFRFCFCIDSFQKTKLNPN